MRGGTRQRPNSQHGAQAHMHTPVPPVRKIFNCIVDNSALVAGVKKSTRNGIRQWVRDGQIRLFVPLHALDQLGHQRDSPGKHGQDVRETLQWLDDITSKYPNIVTLQGADETYDNWADVEKFAVPRTLFSENDGLEDMITEQEGNLSQLALDHPAHKTPVSSAASDGSRSLSPSSLRSQRSASSAPSPPTSPVKADASPVMAANGKGGQANTTIDGSVPKQLQPLFNYILWRIHQEVDPVAALESFIFLCNDQRKVNYAKGFEIRTKRLEQLREAINREDRDYKNRATLLNKESQNAATPNSPKKDDDEDDSGVIYKPPPRAPAAMMPQPQTNVLDPDAFGRNPQSPKSRHASPKQQPATVAANLGGFQPGFASRGVRGGNFRGNPRGRANFGPALARPTARADNAGPNAQIDPNSFTRPRGSGYTGRGGRKLWVPT